MSSLQEFRPTDDDATGQQAGPVYLTPTEALYAYGLEMHPQKFAALKTTILNAQRLAGAGYWMEPCAVEGRYIIRGGRSIYTWDAREQRCSCPLFSALGTCKHSIAAAAGELPITARAPRRWGALNTQEAH